MPLVPRGFTWERVWALPWVVAAVPPTPIAELVFVVAPTPTLEADVPPALALPALPPVAPAWVWLPAAVELAVGGVWVWAAAPAATNAAAMRPVCIMRFMILLLVMGSTARQAPPPGYRPVRSILARHGSGPARGGHGLRVRAARSVVFIDLAAWRAGARDSRGAAAAH